MSGSPRRANWRDKRKTNNWIDELVTKSPAIARVVAPATPHRDALELVFLLRNWVHAEGLSSLPVVGDPHRLDRVEHQLLLPQADTGLLMDAIRRLGGPAGWGVRQIAKASYTMDLGSYVEAILPRALAAMGEIMDLTSVETLPGATTARSARGQDARESMAAERVRLLSGLG
jgi:hypothetical protein